MVSLCRDCFQRFNDTRVTRCIRCDSPRLLSHPELLTLAIAHMDCDAFFASVEKRDNPELASKPVIVGGGNRGVVSTCCYLARIKGVRSAMPMFKALQLCPEAVVLRPRMARYAEVSAQIRSFMDDLTPAIEPLSLDEAFLDLSGTEKLHGAPPVVMLAKLAKRIKDEIGVTASIGLSHNKFLAKIASDLEKPRGFSLIGRAETAAFLSDRPVRMVFGIGASGEEALERAGIRTFTDLKRWELEALVQRFGTMGERLWHIARGEDSRPVSAHHPIKSISNETTFEANTSDLELLDGHLWRLAEKTAARAKAKEVAGQTVTLKLRRANFSLLTRSRKLSNPTQLADTLYRTARALLAAVPEPGPWRLIGVGLSDLGPASKAQSAGDLFDPDAPKREAAERAADAIRARFGVEAIQKGRALKKE